MIFQLLLLAQGVDIISVKPGDVDGSHLDEGRSCHNISLGDDVIGHARQDIEAASHAGEAVWKITIRQEVPGRSFKMRDEFVVRQANLLPISLISERGSNREASGWQRVSIAYDGGFITGTRETRGGIVPIRERTETPVWDGNLWGLLFASLPLAPGARFEIPMWQYDKDFGLFQVRVAGSGPVSTPNGTEQAWLLEAGADPDRLVRYVMSKEDLNELSYEAGPMRQALSSNCRL